MILFKEDTHQYFNQQQKEYTSVTTLIGKYKNPFESGYWATYKAIKDVLSTYGEWADFKREAGGWEKVVRYWTIRKRIYMDEILDRVNYYFQLWEETKDEACVRGSRVHKELEDAINNCELIQKEDGTYKVLPKSIIETNDFTSNLIITEALIYDHEYEIAGQVDRIDQQGMVLHIEDYKTNKEITREAFNEQKMKGPLSCLPDANYYHYLMQLNTYGWILARHGYTIGSMRVIHIIQRLDLDGSVIDEQHVPYDIPERFDLVTAMMIDFKRNRLIKEEF